MVSRRFGVVAAGGLLIAGCASELTPPDSSEPEGSSSSGAPSTASCGLTAPTTLLETDHAWEIHDLLRVGDRVLSGDEQYHWILWDATARRAVASGDATAGYPHQVTAAGEVFTVRHETSVDVRAMSDGALLSRIDVGASNYAFGIAVDGSYVWTATDVLQIWSPEGLLLRGEPATIHSESVFAGPTQFQYASGATITLLPIDGGPATVVSASFAPGDAVGVWFGDGRHFTSIFGASGALQVYALDGTLVRTFPDLTSDYGAGGYGDLVWGSLRGHDGDGVYQIDSIVDGAPVRLLPPTDTLLHLRGSRLSFQTFGDDRALVLQTIDLDGGPDVLTPTGRDIGDGFSADAAGYAFPDAGGLVFCADTGMPAGDPLDVGGVVGVVGSPAGRVAMTTMGGSFTAELGAGKPRVSGGPYVKGILAAISTDGKRALSYAGRGYAITDAATGAIIGSGALRHLIVGADLLGEGDRFAAITCKAPGTAPCSVGIYRPDGTAEVLRDGLRFPTSHPPKVRASPDGVHVAYYDGRVHVLDGWDAGDDPGALYDWVDANTLLLEGRLVTSEGETLRALPAASSPRVSIAGDLYLDVEKNTAFSLVDGSVRWTGPADVTRATTAGTCAVYLEGRRVIAEPLPVTRP